MVVLKKYANLLLAYYNYYTRAETITNYPIIAFVEPTASCNLHCPACPTGRRLSGRHEGTLSIGKFKELIDDIGDYLFVLNMCNWGEPTMHHDFPEMVQYAKSKDIFVRSSTNLSLKLSDEYLERIVLSGLDELIVSVDGLTQETYSKYRIGGNLSVVLSNLKKLHDIKVKYGMKNPVLVWQFLVFRHNEHEIEQVKSVYKELGADKLTISSGLVSDGSGLEAPLNPAYPKTTYTRKRPTRACSQLYGVFVHNPNGAVSPCCAVPFEPLDYGFYSGNVKEAMNSDAFREARRHFKEQDKIVYNASNISGMGLNMKMNGLVCKNCGTPMVQDWGLFFNRFLRSM